MDPLKEGDTVSAVAPCGPVKLAALKDGLATLQSWGLRVKTHGDVTAKDRYLAGTDFARSTALNDAIRDPASRAIFCIRGGYGAARILDRIEWDTVITEEKIFVGFSDVTMFHLAIADQGGSSLHASNLTSHDLQHRDLQSLHDALFGVREDRTFFANPVCPGKAEGPMWGGNLTLLVHGLASGLRIPKGAIIFVEDVNEPDYRLDRALTALAAHKDRIGGLVLGQFLDCEGTYVSSEEFSDFVDLLGYEFGERVGCPVITDFPIGHGERNIPIPMGRMGRIDGETGKVQFLDDLCT